MPHYKDGQEAQIGDIAKGSGYNQTKNKPVVGIVTHVNVDTACNMTMVYTELVDFDKLSKDQQFILVDIEVEPGQFKRKAAVLRMAYGEIQNFEKVL